MKVVVYAICKNEAQFAERWAASMKEADQLVVLDTGSTDDTVQKLQQQGVHVTQEMISPWRFDVARNRSLELVPTDADICVCTDLDEVFSPGWRNLLEQAWGQGVTQAAYRYTWSFGEDRQEGVVFWIEKAHSRHGYQWTHPVHEVLQWVGENQPGRKVMVEGMQLNHYPDHSKSRGQYLPLLEQSVREDPDDDRNMHYLGREYMYQGNWDACITTLQRHLQMPSATWADERAASMRYMAKAYKKKGNVQTARWWYLKAITEAPHLREPYMDLAWMLYEQQDWDGVLYFTSCALQITERPRTYICEERAWGNMPYDLRTIALYSTGRYEESLEAVKKALEYAPDNKRLLRNLELIQKKISE